MMTKKKIFLPINKARFVSAPANTLIATAIKMTTIISSNTAAPSKAEPSLLFNQPISRKTCTEILTDVAESNRPVNYPHLIF